MVRGENWLTFGNRRSIGSPILCLYGDGRRGNEDPAVFERAVPPECPGGNQGGIEVGVCRGVSSEAKSEGEMDSRVTFLPVLSKAEGRPKIIVDGRSYTQNRFNASTKTAVYYCVYRGKRG